MAKNTDVEDLDDSPNIQSENLSEEITATPNLENINPNQETENMEVHHHAHDPAMPHHKKNWTSYFWEFLMLFLAVFCGFLAESYHTHLINKGIEKRNIETYIHNLESDTIGLNRSIKFCEGKIKLIDSLINVTGEFTDSSYQKKFFYYSFELGYTDNYRPDESSFLQMQSSNALRLISKQNVTDSILKYHQLNLVLLEQKANVGSSFNLAENNLTEITDFRKYPNLSFNGNNQQIQNYINNKIIEKYSSQNYLDNFLKRQLQTATNLIPFLKKEYGIQ